MVQYSADQCIIWRGTLWYYYCNITMWYITHLASAANIDHDMLVIQILRNSSFITNVLCCTHEDFVTFFEEENKFSNVRYLNISFHEGFTVS